MLRYQSILFLVITLLTSNAFADASLNGRWQPDGLATQQKFNLSMNQQELEVFNNMQMVIDSSKGTMSIEWPNTETENEKIEFIPLEQNGAVRTYGYRAIRNNKPLPAKLTKNNYDKKFSLELLDEQTLVYISKFASIIFVRKH